MFGIGSSMLAAFADPRTVAMLFDQAAAKMTPEQARQILPLFDLLILKLAQHGAPKDVLANAHALMASIKEWIASCEQEQGKRNAG